MSASVCVRACSITVLTVTVMTKVVVCESLMTNLCTSVLPLPPLLLLQAVVTQQAKLKRHRAKSAAIGGQPHQQAFSKTNVERLEVAGAGR